MLITVLRSLIYIDIVSCLKGRGLATFLNDSGGELLTIGTILCFTAAVDVVCIFFTLGPKLFLLVPLAKLIQSKKKTIKENKSQYRKSTVTHAAIQNMYCTSTFRIQNLHVVAGSKFSCRANIFSLSVETEISLGKRRYDDTACDQGVPTTGNCFSWIKKT
ncbi:hypothetical protein ACJX0J_029262 [Zea mays]